LSPDAVVRVPSFGPHNIIDKMREKRIAHRADRRRSGAASVHWPDPAKLYLLARFVTDLLCGLSRQRHVAIFCSASLKR
jgi:hypothetical protein